MSVQDNLAAGKIEVRFGDLVEDAMALLYRTEERPLPVFVGDIDIQNAGDADFSVDRNDDVHRTDLLEYGHELMLVTSKSEDIEPVMHVIRQYSGTPNEGLARKGTPLLKNPKWQRHRIWRSMIHGLNGSIATALPYMAEEQYMVPEVSNFIPLPDDTIDVARVGISTMDATDGGVFFDGWSFLRDFSQTSTGQALMLSPRALSHAGGGLLVRRITPYPTRLPGDQEMDRPLSHDRHGEEHVVTVWVGTSDIVSLYAAAYSLMGREMTRVEASTMQEWNDSAFQRVNVNLKAAQLLWQTYYQRLDEARQMHATTLSKHRPFVRRGTAYRASRPRSHL